VSHWVKSTVNDDTLSKDYDVDENIKNKLQKYLSNSNPEEVISCTITLN
jgi:hypothetical protein